MNSMNKDLALDILKLSFPKGENIKIINDTLEDDNLHFTSNITHFTVEYKQDGKIQRKHLVMKIPRSGEIYSFFDSFECYDREIKLYDVLLPSVNKYLDKNLTPAHIYTTDSRILILEDVTARGYESGEKLPLLDFHQTKSILKALAHFHAASHKFHEENPQLFKDLLLTHVPGIEFRRNTINNWAPIILELLKRKNETQLIIKLQSLISFLKRDDEEIRAIVNQSRFEFVTLVHGDSRKDNLFLKFNSEKEVEDVQFIDFQLSLWSCPLLDIFFLFTTSVSIDIMATHYEDFINCYLQELNEKLRKLDCTSTYDRSNYDKDFQTLRFFWFTSLLCFCCIFNPMDHKQKTDSFSNKTPDISHLTDLCLNDEKFVHAIYGWMKFCDKLNIFEGY